MTVEPHDDPVAAAEYRAVMDIVAGSARTLLALEDGIRNALDTVNRAEALGPILHPTAFHYGGAGNLRDAATVLLGALNFINACKSIKPEESKL